MAFVMPKEAGIIQRFRSGILNEGEGAIIDILTEYSAFAKPTRLNVDALLEKAPKVALKKVFISHCKVWLEACVIFGKY